MVEQREQTTDQPDFQIHSESNLLNFSETSKNCQVAILVNPNMLCVRATPFLNDLIRAVWYSSKTSGGVFPAISVVLANDMANFQESVVALSLP